MTISRTGSGIRRALVLMLVQPNRGGARARGQRAHPCLNLPGRALRPIGYATYARVRICRPRLPTDDIHETALYGLIDAVK